MSDITTPNYELAEIDYISGMKYKDIASKYSVTVNTVKSWKTRYEWNRKSVHTKVEKVCTQKKSVRTKKAVVAEEVIQVIDNTELTDQQRDFCVYYSKCFNAAKAYKKAYKCKEFTAMTNGPRLLKNAQVNAVITQLKENKWNKAMLEEEDVFQWYLDIATADMTDYVTFGNEKIEIETEDGERTITVSYVNIKEDSEVDGSLITEISKGKDGVKVKLANKMKAMDWIAKQMNMTTEEQRVKIEKIRSEIEQNNNSSTEVVDAWVSAVTGEDIEEPPNE